MSVSAGVSGAVLVFSVAASFYSERAGQMVNFLALAYRHGIRKDNTPGL